MSRRRCAFALLFLTLAAAGCSDPVRRDAPAEREANRAAQSQENGLRDAEARGEAAAKAAVEAADAEELNRQR